MHLAGVIAKYKHIAANGMSNAVRHAHTEMHAIALRDFRRLAYEVVRSKVKTKGEHKVVLEWLDTFLAEVINTEHSRFSMGTIGVEQLNADKGTAEFDPSQPLGAFDVEEWVRAGLKNKSGNLDEGKVFDGRDAGPIEDVIKRMTGILVYAQDSTNPVHQRIQKKYAPHIRAFRANQTLGKWSTTELGKFLTDTAPRLILSAWTDHIREKWPSIVLKKLEAEGLPR
jgi:hypothetical protein